MRQILSCSLLLLCISAHAADDLGSLATQMNAAHKAHDYAAMEADADKILALIPDYPQVIYLLAEARAGRGDQVGTLAALGRLADMGLYFDIQKNPGFTAQQKSAGFQALVTRFAANLKPVGQMTPAFRLTEPDLIPEGITYDPKSGDFFVASVHLRKILRVHQGKASSFAARDAGLWSVMGLRADPAHGSLWAVSEALPQMQGYDTKLAGHSALFCFDLKSGALKAEYLPPDSDPHGFNDLTVASDGSVYVADDSGGVFVLAAGAKALKPLTAPGTLLSSQGLALSPDEHILYIADYGAALYAYSFADSKLLRVGVPDTVSTFGIDGLYLHGHDLVASQNGVEPQRVMRYRLDDTGLAVASAQVLDANDPMVPEPTLLTVVGDELYLVTDSQWSRFDDAGKLPATGQLQAPLIAKLPLP